MNCLTPEEIITQMNPEEFSNQRRIIDKLVDMLPNLINNNLVTENEACSLEGLQNFMDHIADCAHDLYGMDCSVGYYFEEDQD